MRRFVLDASVAAAWFLPDRNVEYAIHVRHRLGEGDRALVPNLWSVEMANLLARAARKGNLSGEDSERALGQLQILVMSGPRIEVEATSPAVWVAYQTARKYQITAYDGVYLELAQREGIALATLDSGLRLAASKAGVSILDEQLLS